LGGEYGAFNKRKQGDLEVFDGIQTCDVLTVFQAAYPYIKSHSCPQYAQHASLNLFHNSLYYLLLGAESFLRS
jgi:hypothetical protein